MFWFLLIPFCSWFAILNRARGSRLFNHTTSTLVGRLVSMGLMATATAALAYKEWYFAFPWTFASLMLWCTPHWDKYWSAAIGNDLAHSRLWGLATMTLRQFLIVPCIIGLAFIVSQPLHALWATGAIFLGLPYYISGYMTPGVNVIRNAELTVGGIIGFLIFMVMV